LSVELTGNTAKSQAALVTLSSMLQCPIPLPRSGAGT